MTIIDDIAAYLTHLRAQGRPDTTVRQRSAQLRRLAHEIGLHRATGAISTSDLEAWLAVKSWARETRRGHVSALRGFFAWAAATGRTEADPARALPAVRPAPAVARPADEPVYRAALAAAPSAERLALRLAGECGLRRGEIVQIMRADLMDTADGRALWVHGKGGRARIVPLPADIARALAGACLAGGGYAYPSARGGHITPYWLARRVRRYLHGATLHQLRHRFATRVYAASGDLLAVQTLLGHVSAATTQRYVALAGDRLRAALLTAA